MIAKRRPRKPPPAPVALPPPPAAPPPDNAIAGLCDRWRELWKDHGTKILGYGASAVGVLELLDTHTVELIATHLGPKWGPTVKSGLLILIGIGVAWRGYNNSKAQPK